MVTFAPVEFVYFANNGSIDLVIQSPLDAVMFERSVPFGTPLTTAPAFGQVLGVFADGPTLLHHKRGIPIGALYQARLYARENLAEDGNPAPGALPIGQIDAPSILFEVRKPFLTACALKPRVKLDVGGTSLGIMAVSGGEDTRMTLAVGDIGPTRFPADGQVLPRFLDRGTIATGNSQTRSRIHRFVGPDVYMRDGQGVPPNSDIWFYAAAWNRAGEWDFVWNTDTAGGDGTALKLHTHQRQFHVDVTKLTCVESPDSEDSFHFKLALVAHPIDGEKGDRLKDAIYTWDEMDDGQSIDPPLKVRWTGDEAHRRVLVSLLVTDHDLKIVGYGNSIVEFRDGEPQRREIVQTRIRIDQGTFVPLGFGELTVQAWYA